MEDQIDNQQLSNKPSILSKVKYVLSANKFLIIIVAVLTMLSLSTTGYILTANKKNPPSSKLSAKQTESTPFPSPLPTKTVSITQAPLQIINTPSPTPTLTVDTTATWSAFLSTKYGYSLKYPPNWSAKITDQTDPKILEYVVFNPVATKAGTLSITLSYGTRTYAQALALDPQTGESIIVASASATKKNSKDSNGNKATNVIVPLGSNSIIFNAKDAFASLFSQMLTTLKLK